MLVHLVVNLQQKMKEEEAEDDSSDLNNQLDLEVNSVTSGLSEVLTGGIKSRTARQLAILKKVNISDSLDYASSANNGMQHKFIEFFTLKTRTPNSDSGGIRKIEFPFKPGMFQFHAQRGQLNPGCLRLCKCLSRCIGCRQLPRKYPWNRNRRPKCKSHNRFNNRYINNICVVRQSSELNENIHQQNPDTIAFQMEKSLNLSSSRKIEQSSFDITDQTLSSPTGVDSLALLEKLGLPHNIENIENDFKRMNID
ncbi:unnamed protein product [Rodentolepis nana]|uniref:Uncharacterized protein n=1 Tax=Rodentolepis nana TaxID=102285 RepID=A0A0R3T308_RODNA|nr:unnamed protein product [Rodentolepis nana]